MSVVAFSSHEVFLLRICSNILRLRMDTTTDTSRAVDLMLRDFVVGVPGRTGGRATPTETLARQPEGIPAIALNILTVRK
jgi:hypothetical protein